MNVVRAPHRYRALIETHANEAWDLIKSYKDSKDEMLEELEKEAHELAQKVSAYLNLPVGQYVLDYLRACVRTVRAHVRTHCGECVVHGWVAVSVGTGRPHVLLCSTCTYTALNVESLHSILRVCADNIDDDTNKHPR